MTMGVVCAVGGRAGAHSAGRGLPVLAEDEHRLLLLLIALAIPALHLFIMANLSTFLFSSHRLKLELLNVVNTVVLLGRA
jgi:hypothetical protein